MLRKPIEGDAIRITGSRLFLLVLISCVLGITIVLDGLYFRTAFRFGDRSFSSSQPAVVNDFISHYAGARLALRGEPERAYDFNEARALEREVTGDADFVGIQLAYPPFFYLLLMPLAYLDIMWAYRLWVALTLAAALLVAFRIDPHWHTLLLVPIFPAVVFSATAGQNGILSATLIGAGLLLLPNRSVAAGIAFGLLAYKPQLALALPFCLAGGRHYRALMAMAVTAFATALLSVLAFGPDAFSAFLSNLQSHGAVVLGGSSEPLWKRMPTLMASILQTTNNRTLAWTVFALVAAGALGALFFVWRRSRQPTVRALALTAAMPLVTPYFFDYDLAVLVIPFAYLAREMRFADVRSEHLLAMGAIWMTPLLVTLIAFWPPAGALAPPLASWPLFPAVWVLLLAYASWESSKPQPQ